MNNEQNKTNNYENKPEEALGTQFENPEISPMNIGVQAAGKITPETPVKDPKDYLDAPVQQVYGGSESIVLNSGAVQNHATDLVFPGKNGLDLVISRIYDSQTSNKEDLSTMENKKVTHYHTDLYRCYYNRYGTIRQDHELVEHLWFYNKSKMDKIVNGYIKDYKTDFYWDEGEQQASRMECWYGRDNPPDRNNPVFEYVAEKNGIQSTVRPNDHFQKLYGLGYGWRFAIPSIESVTDHVGYRIKTSTFFHLEDGRSLKLNEAKNGFEKYTLRDIVLRKASDGAYQGCFELVYKDGRIASFDAAERCVRMTDRFGNAIVYTYDATGRLSEITDSFGRTLELKQNGSTLQWRKKDTGEVLFTYEVSNETLSASIDAQNRKTTYHYTVFSLEKRLLHSDAEDQTPYIDYYALTGITTPSGAYTAYTYQVESNNYISAPHGGKQSLLLVNSRKDIADPTKPTVYCNEETYQYKLASYIPDGMDDYEFAEHDHKPSHISAVIVLSHKNPASNVFEHKSVHTFNKDGLRTRGQIYHIIDSKEILIQDQSISYKNKLPSIETTMSYSHEGQSSKVTKNWTYDTRANVTKYTENYANDSSLDQETSFTYDANYSIQLSKTVVKNSTESLIERAELRAESTGKPKLVEWTKLFQKIGTVETLREKQKLEYDAENRLLRQRRYYGSNLETSTNCHTTAFIYDDTALTPQPSATELSGVLDADGNLVLSPFGAGVIRTEQKFDWYGRTTETTDANGNTTKFTYDALGRLIKQENPDGSTTANSYDDLGNKITSVNENGVSQLLEYTPMGQLAKVSVASADTAKTLLSSYAYDTLGRLMSQQTYAPDSAIRTRTEKTYDIYDMERKTVTTGGTETMESYTDYTLLVDGKFTKVVKTQPGDEYAPTVTAESLTDLLGREVQVKTGSITINSSYDKFGNKLSEDGPNPKSWLYDYAGRVTKETNVLGQNMTTAYDSLGNQISVTNHAGDKTEFFYDAAGRLLRQESPFEGAAKAVTIYGYDPMGNVTMQKTLSSAPGEAEIWRTSRTTYDSRNRIVDVIAYENDGSEIRSRCEYDPAGNKTAVYTGMQGSSLTGAEKTIYKYDRFNNVVEIIGAASSTLPSSDPAFCAETYAYDSTGRLLQKTNRGGETISYTYDGLGRVVTQTVTEANGEKSFTETVYTKTGQTFMTRNKSLTTEFRYDEMGRVIMQSGGGAIAAYTYDANGNRKTYTLNYGGKKEVDVETRYDRLNRLEYVFDWRVLAGDIDAGVSTGYYYDGITGNLKSMIQANNPLETHYSYNKANLLTQVDNRLSEPGVSASVFTYTYFLDGNQRTKTDLDGNVTTYTYDSMGRLTCEHEQREHGTNVITYEYDRFGNRVKMVKTGAETSTTTYEYAAGNLLMREVKTDHGDTTETRYTYDKNGSQTEKRTSENSHLPKTEKMRYNGLGQLVRFTKADGYGVEELCATYAYRPDGLRHGKTVKKGSLETTHMHLWDGQNIVAEVGATGVVTARFIRGLALIAREQDGQLQYYFHNAHGDIVQRYDNLGNLLKNYRYDAFGVEEDIVESDANPFRYCGEYFDKETETIYLRARQYSPTTGRFISQDPAGAGNNWYAYCSGNPVNTVDPSGLISENEIKEVMNLYEQDKMAPMAYTYCFSLIYDWYLTDNQQEKDKLDSLFNEFKETGYTTTNGKNKKVDEGIAYMPKRPTSILTEEDHYFRNELNLEFTWDEIEKFEQVLPDFLQWNGDVMADLHQNQTIGKERNKKVVSNDGYFEMVFSGDKSHILWTAETNYLDMGTYNYGSPTDTPIQHGILDVVPYYMYWNTKEDAKAHEKQAQDKSNALAPNFTKGTEYGPYGCLRTSPFRVSLRLV